MKFIFGLIVFIVGLILFFLSVTAENASIGFQILMIIVSIIVMYTGYRVTKSN